MLNKICIVTGSFPARSETFVVEHAVGLASRGYDVTIVSKGPGVGIRSAELEIINSSGVKTVNIKPYGQKKMTNCIRMLLGILRRPKLIQFIFNSPPWTRRELFMANAYAVAISEINANVLHIHYGSYAGAIRRVGNHNNTIVTWHGYDANMLPLYRGDDMYRELFASSSLHTVGSGFMRTRLSNLGAGEDRIIQIPMGVDLSKFDFVDRTNRSSNIVRLISIGRLGEMKGHRFLIKAIRRLLDEGIELELKIAGEGPLHSEIEKLILDLDLSSNVSLLGSCTSSQVRDHLAWADLFALTGVLQSNGRVETQGVVYAEAQATGLPVVACDVGGVSESLIHGKTGLIVPSKNVSEIAAAIKQYALNEELRLNHGRNAAEFVLSNFSIEKMLDSLEELYSQHTEHTFCLPK